MNGTSSATSFFSFGPDDGFISKSYEGLRYNDLPAALLALIDGGSVQDVHWASLGPTPDSWLLSFKDSAGTPNLAWGASIPTRLQKALSKLAPSQHMRVFLGPSESYIAWDATFIRWSNLPTSLEDTLQSWLTPSGWCDTPRRAGPPRMLTWGPDDAFFAMSEYGDVAYRLGDKRTDDWEIWRETVEDWKAERGFRWSEVAYVALDPTTLDQFVAIRNDGTWSGSIADENSSALESFAHNFFRRAKTKQKAKTPHEGTNGHTHTAAQTAPGKDKEEEPDHATKVVYQTWSTRTALLFASALAATTPTPAPSTTSVPSPTPPPKRNPKKLQIRSQSQSAATASPATASPADPNTSTPLPRPSPALARSKSTNPSSTPESPPPAPTLPRTTLLTSFPYLPPSLTTCPLPGCALQKADPIGLRACKHDVERLLRGSGNYGYEWLKKERLRWHPDRFGRLCEVGYREEGRKVSEEMWKVIDILLVELNGEGKS
ncbi:hypothetical protein PMIN01_07099 [Paraphaeosphaeria minitans]|uniref:Uncharacterized protein n=1 Tax=Paraphaeosphaeria minitans TaxID=565426 RepID=A0A9P6GEJ9_9PLEO|nr:hypothetical protein PMIN01_07099 [Paraphaeosphaeria minitans]